MNGASKVRGIAQNLDDMHSLGQFTRGDTPKAERHTAKMAGSLYRYGMLRHAHVQSQIGNHAEANALRSMAAKSRKTSNTHWKTQATNRAATKVAGKGGKGISPAAAHARSVKAAATKRAQGQWRTTSAKF
jgi:hypothetical protein